MGRVIKVNASRQYDVVIGSGLLGRLGEFVRPLIKGDAAAIIADANTAALYASRAETSLKDAGFNVIKFVFPAGEKSKNLNTYGEILEFLAENGITRKDAVIALGGGVTGDLAGFAAATYLRGIDFIQVPTTLLSMIDSSVGGKTGIDLKAGKNLAGAFYQPALVLADTDTLKTLPEEEVKSGIGELIKYALLAGGETWNIVRGGEALTENAIALCVNYKKEIVEKDEREAGPRRLLNLGHTPAHAIEKLSSFSVPHGTAVGTGLAIIAKASLKFGLPEEKYKDIIEVLEKYGFPLASPFTAKELASAAVNDKKSESDGVNLVLIKDIGECCTRKVSFNKLEELFS